MELIRRFLTVIAGGLPSKKGEAKSELQVPIGPKTDLFFVPGIPEKDYKAGRDPHLDYRKMCEGVQIPVEDANRKY